MREQEGCEVGEAGELSESGEVSEGVSGGSDAGQFLSAEDEDGVRNFVNEFVAQRLVPHMEAVLKNLNEWVCPLDNECVHTHKTYTKLAHNWQRIAMYHSQIIVCMCVCV